MTPHSPTPKKSLSNEHKVIVSKFGGSSMADAIAIRRSAEIAIKQGSSVVVVSATYGTTNSLVEMIDAAENCKRKWMYELISVIRASHVRIAENLAVSDSTLRKLKEMLDTTEALAQELESAYRQLQEYKSMKPDVSQAKEKSPSSNESLLISIKRLRDRLLGMGERLSSLLITDNFNQSGVQAGWLDAGDIILTDDRYSHAVPQFEEIEALCEQHIRPLLKQQKLKKSNQHNETGATQDDTSASDSGKNNRSIVVTQGFIGSTSDGHATTLGRGGSDYSAAIIAWGLDADILQIWTDVNGMATTDPRIVSDARPISEISFQEAAELATFGAKILHPSTLIPAIWKEIPVFVGSSLLPDAGGTWIFKDVGDAPLVRALAIRRSQALLTLTTPQMLHTYGFLYRIFKVFNDHRVSVDSITTSEISVAMTVDAATLNDQALISDLEELGRLKIEESYELISLIGNNINHTAGLAKRVFAGLTDINVRMICQGASRHNFCFLVKEGRGEEAIRLLHSEFIT